MHIWVDADACPLAVKEILFRAAERMEVPLTLVANKLLGVPRSSWIRSIQVSPGFDVADNEIARRLAPGDLVITADVPLAADVIGRGGHALNPRGELYTQDNIRERLQTRDFLAKLRETGVQTGGPAVFDNVDRKRFADQLDKFLSRKPGSPTKALGDDGV